MNRDSISDGPYDARQVANLLLDIADREERPLTKLSLLKLVYFAHGWFLAKNGRPLVRNRFEAWQYGPVVKVLYQQFRSQTDEPISTRACFFNPITRESSLAEPNFPEDVLEFIYGIYREYSRHSAFMLSDMTHEKGGPWEQVWNRHSGEINPGMIISNEQIMSYFRGIARTARSH